MKKLLVIIIFFLLATSVQADSNIPTGTGATANFDDVLELELIKGYQNPRTLEFEYILRVKSLIQTDRVRMNWEFVEGLVTPVEGESLSDQVVLRQGEEVFISKKFIPLQAGFEEIRINGIAFGPSAIYDYYSFTDEEFFIDEELLIRGDSSEYQMAGTISSVLNILKLLLSVTTVLFIILIIYLRFRLWLDSED